MAKVPQSPSPLLLVAAAVGGSWFCVGDPVEATAGRETF